MNHQGVGHEEEEDEVIVSLYHIVSYHIELCTDSRCEEKRLSFMF